MEVRIDAVSDRSSAIIKLFIKFIHHHQKVLVLFTCITFNIRNMFCIETSYEYITKVY